MSPSTVYLVTGANRGIGRGLTATYLSRPNNTVVAAVRDVSSTTTKSLATLPKGPGSRLIVVKIDAVDEKSPSLAVKSLQSAHGITHIDVVIANSGICQDFSPIATVSLADIKEHIAVNAYGPLLLFQAVIPLMEKSNNAKFAALGSPMGSIGGIDARPFSMTAYGMSKSPLHWVTRKIYQEHPDIVSIVLDPGFVQTDMGNAGAIRVGMKEAVTTIDGSVRFLTATIDGATKELSGHFPSIEGGDFAAMVIASCQNELLDENQLTPLLEHDVAESVGIAAVQSRG